MTAAVISLAEERSLREQLELSDSLAVIRSAAIMWLTDAIAELEAEPVPRTDVIARYRASLEMAQAWSITMTSIAVRGKAK